jgi:fimbrial isopeptide formation D2 family protein/LPXTG-motif cell wall-anchored protein
MKAFKKFGALLVAALLIVAALAPAAMATDPTPAKPKITLDSSAANVQPQTHDYKAYQIFKGTVAGTTISVTDWGTGIDGEAFLAALKADEKFGAGASNLFANCTDAASVAKVINAFSDKDANAIEFAKVANPYLKTGTDVTTTGVEVDPGYYLVKDVNSNVPEGQEDFTSANIMKVVNDVTVTPKGSVPTPGKTVTTNAAAAPNATAEGKKTDTADIGDTVYFTLTGTVSDALANFDEYFFEFEDHPSNGLTFNKIEAIYVGGTKYVYTDGGASNSLIKADGAPSYSAVSDTTDKNPAQEGWFEAIMGGDPAAIVGYKATEDATPVSGKTYYTIGITSGAHFAVTEPANTVATERNRLDDPTACPENGGGTMKVTFPNLRNLPNLQVTDEIRVVYSAIVNKNAIQGGVGNDNDVVLNYSNDPNNKDKGKSIPSESTVFNVTLDVEKVNAADKTKNLAGAGFVLSREVTDGGVTNTEYAIVERQDNGDYKLIGWTTTAYTGEPKDNPNLLITTNGTEDTYTAVETPSGDPHSEGWYQVVAGSDPVTYEATNDTTVQAGKTYYTKSSSPKYKPLVVKGLEYAKTYKLTETVAPAGYDVPAAPKNETTFAIVAATSGTTSDDGANQFKLDTLEIEIKSGDGATAGNGGSSKANGDKTTGTVEATITNSNDLTLPQTGGIGTTIFYTVGALLVVGAGVLLVTRRRVAVK